MFDWFINFKTVSKNKASDIKDIKAVDSFCRDNILFTHTLCKILRNFPREMETMACSTHHTLVWIYC